MKEYKKVFEEIRKDTEAGKIEKQLDKVSPKFREQLRKELEEEARKKKQSKLKRKLKKLQKKRLLRESKKPYSTSREYRMSFEPSYSSKEEYEQEQKKAKEKKRKGSGGRGAVPLSNKILKGGFDKIKF